MTAFALVREFKIKLITLVPRIISPVYYFGEKVPVIRVLPEILKLDGQQSVTSGLYYKPMTIENDNSRVANKHEASRTDEARVVIYDCQMFIVQATEL